MQLSEDKIAKFLTKGTEGEEMQEYAFTYCLMDVIDLVIYKDKYPLITIQRNRPMFLKKFYPKESLLRT